MISESAERIPTPLEVYFSRFEVNISQATGQPGDRTLFKELAGPKLHQPRPIARYIQGEGRKGNVY